MSEKDVTLGEFLRNERELRGITIEQVASATKVGVRTLHALEADHYSELPAKPYIRGFVTSYCRFIGLDPKEIRSRFDQYISKRAMDRPNREGGHSGYAFEKKDGDQQSRTILMIGICAFMVIGGGFVLFFKPSLKHHRASHIDRLRAAQSTSVTQEGGVTPAAQVLPSPAASLSVVAEHGSGSPAPQREEASAISQTAGSNAGWSGPLSVEPAGVPEVSPQAVQPSPSPVSSSNVSSDDPLDSGLALKTDEIHHKAIFKPEVDVWFRYQVDARPVRKFIVRKGKVLVLRAAHQILVQVTEPGFVPFSYNGKNYSSVIKSKLTRLIHGAASLSLAEGTSESHLFDSEFFKSDSGLPNVSAAESKQKLSADE